jgi:Xaa-Pro aminopeptidase
MEEKEYRNKLIYSPVYKTSCLSTIKSFFMSSENLNLNDDDDVIDIDNNEKIPPISVQFNKFNSTKRLELLRKQMKLNNITTYIIPSEDEHQSEYTAKKDQRREFITGFTGSSGIAIVTLNSAALSTDSRYFIQANEQIDSNWILLKQGIIGYPNWIDWMIDETIYLMDQLKESGIIAVDPRLITWKLGNELIRKCHENNLRFINDLDYNLIDLIKGKNNEKENHNNLIYKFDLKYSGLPCIEKIQLVRNQMKLENSFVYISNMLDSIAWILNLRGNDIKFNPVFFSYLIIYMDKIILYIDKKKINKEILNYLKNDLNILIKSYNQIWDDLPAIKNLNLNLNLDLKKFEKENICLELNSNYSIYINIPSIYDIKFRSIITELKGIKNEIEILNLKESQLIDSLAIIKFFSWFDNNFKKFKLNELDIVDKLLEFRKKNLNFKGLSFPTIVASGLNSAIVHYEPTNENFNKIENNNILLIDSGGQYFQGTTDITRTHYVYLTNEPNENLKRAYSLVLNGHLKIAMLKFLKGTSSYSIDKLAREPLLKFGMNYGHGTGHGIDNFICVHSGPCGLSPSKTSYNYKPLEPGNFISNEPGYYKEGEFGIRIESDILVKESENEKDYLEFEYLTFVPFCKKLINKKYLNNEQIKWINDYHLKIRELFIPMLNNEEIEWLINATSEI